MCLDILGLPKGIDTFAKTSRIWYMLSRVFSENESEILKESTLAGMEAVQASSSGKRQQKSLTS
jgi:hypothetical protein